ncbi:MAG TPA: metal ABC transporter substrate-binding protein, partial [Achromobacter sp.]|nr:metal ABC transporter substrate-binding protein [Achromobacter sp.]
MSLKSGFVTLRRAALAVAMASALGAAVTAHAQEAAKSGRAA